MNTHYLAVLNNSWGKGESLKKAKAALRKASGKSATGAAIYSVPADYYIDEMGHGRGSAAAVLLSGKDVRK